MENINELVKYNVTDAALESYRNEFLPLTINGIDDREGYEKVREARLFIKGERVNVEKIRVQLKADSLEFGRAVDAEAKRITNAILEVEGHLEAEQKKIDDEKARIKFEAQQREKLPERMQKLIELGENAGDVDHPSLTAELLKLDDNGFTELVNRLTAEKLERQAREQAAKEAELKAQQEKVDAEKRAIESERLETEREQKHRAEVEEARKKAAEDARIQAEIDAQRKQDERIEAQRQADLEAQRIEAERPDAEKLKLFAAFFESDILYPEVSGKKAAAKVARVRKLVGEIVSELKAA